jgi:hypothetical protein
LGVERIFWFAVKDTTEAVKTSPTPLRLSGSVAVRGEPVTTVLIFAFSGIEKEQGEFVIAGGLFTWRTLTVREAVLVKDDPDGKPESLN